MGLVVYHVEGLCKPCSYNFNFDVTLTHFKMAANIISFYFGELTFVSCYITFKIGFEKNINLDKIPLSHKKSFY